MIRYAIFAGLMLTATSALAQEVDPEDGLRAEDALNAANQAAAAGKFSTAVEKYRDALKLAPGAHPLAYFNLAEVQKVRGKCGEAVLMYAFYESLVGTEEAKKEAAAGVQKCKATNWPKLEVAVEPSEGAQIYVDGYLASTGGTFGPVPMPEGSHEVRMMAIDHHPQTKSVNLKDEGGKVEGKLEKMTFFGTIKVNSSVPGARVRIFEGPSDETKQLADVKAPMTEGVKVREGRHFVEVTAEGYKRWIRNVSVGRDDEAVIDVELTKALPPELRR